MKKLGIFIIEKGSGMLNKNEKKIKLNTTDYKILDNIMKNPKVSRTDLSKILELTPAAITKAIKKLILCKLVEEKKLLSSTGGRPKVALAINGNYKKIIGINLGVGFIRLVLSDLNGKIIMSKERKFTFKTQEKVLSLLHEEIKFIILGEKKENIIGIGLATHGIVNKKRGIVIMSPHFKWKNLEIKKKLEKEYNIPVIVENDVRAMLMAENIYGCAKQMKNFMLLYIKNGVGAAMFLNEKIFEGSNYASGEIGHFIVNENSTMQCRCGKYGCLETEYSEQSTINKVMWNLEERGIKKDKMDINLIYKLANEKQEPYFSIIKETAFETGKVVGNVLNIIDVNDVVIAGDIAMTGILFINNFKNGINKMLLEDFSKKVKVHKSKLDDTIGIYGAISLITTNLFRGEKLLKI